MDAVTFEDVVTFLGYLFGILAACLVLAILIGAAIHVGSRE